MKYRFLFIYLITIAFNFNNLSAQNAQNLYDEGIKLRSEKKITEAQQKFKEAIALKNNFYDAIFELGWCQNELEDYQGSIKTLYKLKNAWNNIPGLYFEMGYAFEHLSKIDSAIICYKRCLKIDPFYVAAYKQLGYIASDQQDYEYAIKQFEEYEVKFQKEITDYLYWYNKGFVQNELADYANALISLKKSLNYKQDYINTYSELGFASLKVKLDEEAINYYKKVIEMDSKKYSAYSGIAQVYRDNKMDMKEAMVWYKKALDINPYDKNSMYGMGYCLNSTDQYNDAVSYFISLLAKYPDYAPGWEELGYSCYKTEKYSEAIDNFNKAIRLDPKNQNARYYAALVYIKQKNKSMAQVMLDELKILSSGYVTDVQEMIKDL